MRPTLAHILLFFSSLCFVVARTNFTQCLEDFKNDPNATGGVDFRGHPSGPAQAAGFTYETCTSRCGPEWEGFIWRDFAQLFSSWLLPWLALVGQLPLGSGNHVDDLISGQLPFPLAIHHITYPGVFPSTISHNERRVPCSSCLLPCAYFLKRSIGLSKGKTMHPQGQI